LPYRIEYSPEAEDHLRAQTAHQRTIIMKTIELISATAPLAECARKVNHEPIILTTRGKPIVALVPIENTDMETVALSYNPKFLAIIERSRARQKAEGGISSDEMRRRLGLKKASRRKTRIKKHGNHKAVGKLNPISSKETRYVKRDD
jgi:antitoxin (DNA-binding transcriptional repressor) of toxin-antitoxin stability system